MRLFTFTLTFKLIFLLNNFFCNISATGYESDSAVSSCSNYSSLSRDTDYLPSAYHTPPSEFSYAHSSSSDTNSSSLMQELEDIRSATPVRELSKRISSWLQNGHYRQSTPIPGNSNNLCRKKNKKYIHFITYIFTVQPL